MDDEQRQAQASHKQSSKDCVWPLHNSTNNTTRLVHIYEYYRKYDSIKKNKILNWHVKSMKEGQKRDITKSQAQNR